MIKSKTRYIKELGLAFLLALVFTLLIKQLAYQSFMVSTDKMMGTLKSGDRVLVNKWAHGSRTPITLLSLPFVDNVFSTKVQLPYNRMPAIRSIKINDIVCYNTPSIKELPIDKKRVDFSRCVALPGDTLRIKDKKLYRNGSYQKIPNQAQFAFRIVTQSGRLDTLWFQKYEIYGGALVSKIGIYDLPMSLLQEAQVDADPSVKYITSLQDFSNNDLKPIFPENKINAWTNDVFGPIVVPQKGQVLSLSLDKLPLYAQLISSYEGNSLEVKQNQIYVNGKLCREYTVQQDYYFLMDDNRDYAFDSRHWGFLPASHVIGRTDLIWMSSLKNASWTNLWGRLPE